MISLHSWIIAWGVMALCRYRTDDMSVQLVDLAMCLCVWFEHANMMCDGFSIECYMQLAVMYLVYDTGYHVWLVIVHRAQDAINLILYNTGYPCSYSLQVTVDSYQQEYYMPTANVPAFMCLVNSIVPSLIYTGFYMSATTMH